MRRSVVLVALIVSILGLLAISGPASGAAAGSTATPVSPRVVPAAAPDATPATTVAQANGYTPITPCRIFDTRPHATTGICSGAPAVSGAFTRGQTREISTRPLVGGALVGVSAVVLNITAVNATAQTYLTAYPSTSPRPLASSVNVAGKAAVANLVTVQIGVGGALDFYNFNGSVNVIVDLQGYFRPLAGAGFTPVTPCRAFDTRGGITGPCAGSANVRAGKLGISGSVTVKLTGVGGIPDSPDITAVILNLTAVNANASTYEKVFPAGSALPLASNLNVISPGAVANLVTVPLNRTNGSITIWNFGGKVDVLGDIAGYYQNGVGASYYPISPCRVFDSRTGGGDCWPTFLSSLAGPLLSTVPVRLQLPGSLGVAGIPAAAKAVAFNLTVVNASTPTYLTVFPADHSLPTVSNINVHARTPLSNQVVVQEPSTGANPGLIQVQNRFGSIDFLIDLAGYYL
jgi:hypothetical protein